MKVLRQNICVTETSRPDKGMQKSLLLLQSSPSLLTAPFPSQKSVEEYRSRRDGVY